MILGDIQGTQKARLVSVYAGNTGPGQNNFSLSSFIPVRQILRIRLHCSQNWFTTILYMGEDHWFGLWFNNQTTSIYKTSTQTEPICPGNQTHDPALARQSLCHWATSQAIILMLILKLRIEAHTFTSRMLRLNHVLWPMASEKTRKVAFLFQLLRKLRQKGGAFEASLHSTARSRLQKQNTHVTFF